MNYISKEDLVHESDFVLDPISYSDILLALENDRGFCFAHSKEERKDIVKRITRKMFNERVEDAMDCVDEYIDGIIKIASPENNDISEEQYEEIALRLAPKICRLVKQYDMVPDFTIFAGHKRFFFENYDTNQISVSYENTNPNDYSNYCRNPNILFMTFDSEIYEAFNYASNPEFVKDFNKLVQDHGFYYEFGEAFNLSLYPL